MFLPDIMLLTLSMLLLIPLLENPVNSREEFISLQPRFPRKRFHTFPPWPVAC